MVNELPRLSVNAVTAQNFALPGRIAAFVSDIFASYSMVSLSGGLNGQLFCLSDPTITESQAQRMDFCLPLPLSVPRKNVLLTAAQPP